MANNIINTYPLRLRHCQAFTVECVNTSIAQFHNNSPHVGKATQADEDSLNPLWDRLSNLYFASRALINGTSLVAISVMIMC